MSDRLISAPSCGGLNTTPTVLNALTTCQLVRNLACAQVGPRSDGLGREHQHDRRRSLSIDIDLALSAGIQRVLARGAGEKVLDDLAIEPVQRDTVLILEVLPWLIARR